MASAPALDESVGHRGGPPPTCSTLRDVTGELEELLGWLDAPSAAVFSKLAGLGEDDTWWSTVSSGTNLAGGSSSI